MCDFLSWLVVFWFVPLVLIAIIYFAIAIKIKSQVMPGGLSNNTRNEPLKRERNILKMCIAIVIMFALSWLPQITVCFLILYPSGSAMMSSCGFQYFAIIAVIMPVPNCSINSCICFICGGNYRLRVLKISSVALLLVSQQINLVLFEAGKASNYSVLGDK